MRSHGLFWVTYSRTGWTDWFGLPHIKIITILKVNADLFIFVKSHLETEMLHPRGTPYINHMTITLRDWDSALVWSIFRTKIFMFPLSIIFPLHFSIKNEIILFNGSSENGKWSERGPFAGHLVSPFLFLQFVSNNLFNLSNRFSQMFLSICHFCKSFLVRAFNFICPLLNSFPFHCISNLWCSCFFCWMLKSYVIWIQSDKVLPAHSYNFGHRFQLFMPFFHHDTEYPRSLCDIVWSISTWASPVWWNWAELI
jgi:hypothetical protein